MENRSNDFENSGNECFSEVKLSDCIEELVKFALYSHLNLLNLSTQFCSTLLKDDPTPLPSSHSDPQDSLEGVPPYPLYKRLASALLRCMDSETFWSPGYNLAMTHEFENSSMQQKHNEWHKLVVEKGSEIINILKSVRLELRIQEPFFTQLKDGLKTIEGRCARGKHNRIEVGNLILFNKSVVFEVQGVRWYPSFFDMLAAESLGKVLPGVESVEEGVKVYRRFFTEEKERENGVLAITFSKSSLQPYMSLASLFSGLNNEGVQGLLGIIHTTGTVPNALPPPRSTLLASFNLPCNPNEIALTNGARALAKHACRSSSGYWGTLDGNDSNKSRLAMNVINHLITHCCWLNIHIVPPHGVVFEIRVAEGYGARWTEDGSKKNETQIGDRIFILSKPLWSVFEHNHFYPTPSLATPVNYCYAEEASVSCSACHTCNVHWVEQLLQHKVCGNKFVMVIEQLCVLFDHVQMEIEESIGKLDLDTYLFFGHIKSFGEVSGGM